MVPTSVRFPDTIKSLRDGVKKIVNIPGDNRDYKNYGTYLTPEQKKERMEYYDEIKTKEQEDRKAFKVKEEADAAADKAKLEEAANKKIKAALTDLKSKKDKYDTETTDEDKIARYKEKIKQATDAKDLAYKSRTDDKDRKAAKAKIDKDAKEANERERLEAAKAAQSKNLPKPDVASGMSARYSSQSQPQERAGDTKKAALNINELFNIQMTLTNLFQYVSFSSPILIVFFITLYSIVQDKILSGLIFNMGIVLISSIVYILKHLLKNKQHSLANPFCNVLPSPFTVRINDNNNHTNYYYDSPSFSSSVLAFSATYLIYPMIIMNQQNVSLLVIAISLVLINAVTEVIYKCSGLFGVILGMLIGIIFAILYYSLLMSSDHTSKYLYFADKESNNTQCSKPGTQNFKCSLYKNGMAISPVATR